MAACPVSCAPGISRRRPLVLTQRRIEANRRNAARSSGPRTPEGKAKVARNAVKHGFFVAQERWTPTEQRDFEETLDGLRDDFRPQGVLEESCIATMAESYVRMAAMLRYENIAALKYHQQRDRELNERIAASNAAQAARLQTQRETLRRAGLWRPTIPGPREVRAIIRYGGSLDRAIRRATSDFEGLRNMRIGSTKAQKQTHYSGAPNNRAEASEGPRIRPHSDPGSQKQTHFAPSSSGGPEPAEGPGMANSSTRENAKTNPLSPMFTGNRHERRRAKALAARRR